jgi:hypothetical protein
MTDLDDKYWKQTKASGVENKVIESIELTEFGKCLDSVIIIKLCFNFPLCRLNKPKATIILLCLLHKPFIILAAVFTNTFPGLQMVPRWISKWNLNVLNMEPNSPVLTQIPHATTPQVWSWMWIDTCSICYQWLDNIPTSFAYEKGLATSSTCISWIIVFCDHWSPSLKDVGSAGISIFFYLPNWLRLIYK